jgi:hypothetical protein
VKARLLGAWGREARLGDSVGLPETEVQRRRPRGKVFYSAGGIGVLLAASSVWLLLAVSPLAVAAELWARCGESALAAAFALKPGRARRYPGAGKFADRPRGRRGGHRIEPGGRGRR